MNSCRKLEGEVGEMAQILIEKWKNLVSAVSSESENDAKVKGLSGMQKHSQFLNT